MVHCEAACDGPEDWHWNNDDAAIWCCPILHECQRTSNILCKNLDRNETYDDPQDWPNGDDDAPWCNKCCPNPHQEKEHGNITCENIDSDETCEDLED